MAVPDRFIGDIKASIDLPPKCAYVCVLQELTSEMGSQSSCPEADAHNDDNMLLGQP